MADSFLARLKMVRRLRSRAMLGQDIPVTQCCSDKGHSHLPILENLSCLLSCHRSIVSARMVGPPWAGRTCLQNTVLAKEVTGIQSIFTNIQPNSVLIFDIYSIAMCFIIGSLISRRGSIYTAIQQPRFHRYISPYGYSSPRLTEEVEGAICEVVTRHINAL